MTQQLKPPQKESKSDLIFIPLHPKIYNHFQLIQRQCNLLHAPYCIQDKNTLTNDTSKFFVKNYLNEPVGWLGSEGNITFTGVGNFTCNANINASNLDDPGSNNVVYIRSGCRMMLN